MRWKSSGIVVQSGMEEAQGMKTNVCSSLDEQRGLFGRIQYEEEGGENLVKETTFQLRNSRCKDIEGK